MLIEYTIYLTGILLFSLWLLRTSFGSKALDDSIQRRNNMPFYVPVFSMLGWIFILTIGIKLAENFVDDSDRWQNEFIINLFMCISEIIVIVLLLIMVRSFFVRRLKGFGLNFKTIPKDIGCAFLNLLTIWPVMAVVLLLTQYIGSFVTNTDYQLQQHQQLQELAQYPQLQSQIMIAVLAVVIVPFCEEIVFRGLFQTTIRSYLSKPHSAWLAVVLSSILFALMHENWDHWPVLFTLGMVMGYSYEKSGSLFRSIFIHMMFNSLSIISNLG